VTGFRPKASDYPVGSAVREQLEAVEAAMKPSSTDATPGEPHTQRCAVYLPIQVVSEANRRGHWSKHDQRRKEHRQTGHDAVVAVPLPAVVRFERIGGNPMDDDNLRSAFKALRDGVADRLGIDDRDPRVRWEYAQRRRKRQEPAGVVIDVEHVHAL